MLSFSGANNRVRFYVSSISLCCSLGPARAPGSFKHVEDVAEGTSAQRLNDLMLFFFFSSPVIPGAVGNALVNNNNGCFFELLLYTRRCSE